FSIASINSAAVSVQGNDAINVNDSNGDPFNGATDVTLFGSGSNNSLDLRGNRSLGGDFFRAGTVTPTSEQDGELAVGFALFQFNHAVNFVSDEVPLVPNVVTTVEAPSGQGIDIQSVTLAGETVQAGQFGGLSNGLAGGTTFTFANKANVALEPFSG